MTGIVDQTGTDGGADPGPRPESQPPVLVCSELVKSAVLYTSHYMDEVARLCDRVGILDHGRLLEEGDPHELPARYGCEDLEAVFLQLTGRELRD